MDLFVTHAAVLARAVETARSRRAFRAAVADFEHLLARVSDYPSDFLTDGDARALSSLADTVADHIEHRLDARADRGAMQRELVRRIYKMRVDVENIYMVLRHSADPARAVLMTAVTAPAAMSQLATTTTHDTEDPMKKLLLVALPVLVIGGATIAACSRFSMNAGGQGTLLSIAQSRNMSPEDAARAIKTFVPPGGRDEYLLFASGGHSGQIHVVGVPSMRLLKTIAVFTPEPWQGYGYGADWSEKALAGDDGSGNGPRVARQRRTATATANGNGNGNGHAAKDPLRWGDAHHPALSETAGKYDGRWIYINDRAHGRIGMVDLSDFRAKQILQVPNLQTSHGGIFATPDTAVRPHLVEGAGAEGVERQPGADASRSTIT